MVRSKNASLLDGDSRYKGKKSSRAALAKQRGQDAVDAKEHASAELGHMFDFGDDDEDEEGDDVDADDLSEGDVDEEEEGDESLASGGSSGESEKESELEDKLIDAKARSSKKEFSFDATDTDFSRYGDDEEEEEEDDESGDESDNDESGAEEEEEGVEDEEGEGSDVEETGVGQVKQESLAQEVAKGQAVQKQLDIWDKEGGKNLP